MARGALAFQRPELPWVAMRGELAVFTTPGALDMPVLGRDVTDHFDIIVSRRHDTVLLLAGSHRLAVQGPAAG